MSLNVPHNLLFKINSVDDNSKYMNKNSTRLRKPILVEDKPKSNNILFGEKKPTNNNDNLINKDNKIYPFIFNKNCTINSGDDISFKMTFDTLTNINFTYPYTLNFPNFTDMSWRIPTNTNNLINLSQKKNEEEENQTEKSNSKLKKKRKCNKFKVCYIETKLKNNYKQNHKRKYKPDDIRKKIKARFHKSIKTIINDNLKKAGSKYFFSFLPQIFISSISRQKNNQVLDLTYRQLLETDFVSNIDESKYKNKKVDYSKYLSNLKVLKYLDEHPDICKLSGFDIMGNMKYKELLEQYFNSEEFDKAINKLREENEEEDYIEEYKSKAKTYVKFFSKINDGKLKSDKLFDINIHNKDNVKEIKSN